MQWKQELETLGRKHRAFAKAVADLARAVGLSARQQEITRLYAEGLSAQEIADRLGLSTTSVPTYACSARRELGLVGAEGASVTPEELVLFASILQNEVPQWKA
jgi:DNA-binding NarL/FixJ family response regulator